jgi:hypothetical protein
MPVRVQRLLAVIGDYDSRVAYAAEPLKVGWHWAKEEPERHPEYQQRITGDDALPNGARWEETCLGLLIRTRRNDHNAVWK